MADLFEFMLGKKDKKQEQKPKMEEKNNYAVLMPVGIYDGSSEEDEYIRDRVASNQGVSGTLKSRRDDYNPYEIEKLHSEEQNMELKRRISDLDDEIRKLNDKIKELNNKNSEVTVAKSRQEYIASTYRNMIEKIVRIMPYYQEIEFTGVGSPEQWNDRKLVEIFVSCVENIKTEYGKKLKEVEQLKLSVSKGESQPKSTDSTMSKVTPKVKDDNSSSDNIFDVPEIPDVPDMIDIEDMNSEIDLFAGGDNASSTDEISYMDAEMLSRYIDKVEKDNQMKVILETIGETGLSRISDLKETDSFKRTFSNNAGEFNQGVLSKKIKELVDLEVLDVEEINTGRKGGNEKIYSLNSRGIQMYKMMFSADAVESEKFAIVRQHTSLEHGYFIKTVAKELESKGYDVFDTPDECVRKPLIALEEGDEKLRVEADLVIKKDGEEYIIECEMGTTSESDMAKKMDKLILVTNTISFIMNNQDSLNKTSHKVDKWLTKKGKNELKGYTIRFTTLDTLKKREIWQNKGPF